MCKTGSWHESLVCSGVGASMKVAILGTRGIPNNYGGFEQFAEFLSIGLVSLDHEVWVYNPNFHTHKKSLYKGVKIISKWCPESIFGPAAHFIYDNLCLRDALAKDFDIILECGYQSASISYYLSRRCKTILVTNMDGLEWQRAKWGRLTRKLTRWFEKLGANNSSALVSDNIGIQEYLLNTYGKNSYCIPYGADVVTDFDDAVLHGYDLRPMGYYLLIARLEPENNIESILDGYVLSATNIPFIVVGNCKTKYGRLLLDKYKGAGVHFVGGVYNFAALNALRRYARLYFHGHSVGGTNPSLLEAMAAQAYICAHNNIFNRSVLGDDAYYFGNASDVADVIRGWDGIKIDRDLLVSHNIEKIANSYSWPSVIQAYERCFQDLLLK